LGPDAPGWQDAAGFKTYGKLKRVVTPRLGAVDVVFRVPAIGPDRVWAGVWGWGEPRFMVSVPHPPSVGEDAAAKAVEQLIHAGFESWKARWLTRYLPLDKKLLERPDLPDAVVASGADSFAALVASGILALTPSSPRGDVGGEIL
jgi:hypothetical protein